MVRRVMRANPGLVPGSAFKPSWSRFGPYDSDSKGDRFPRGAGSLPRRYRTSVSVQAGHLQLKEVLNEDEQSFDGGRNGGAPSGRRPTLRLAERYSTGIAGQS